MKKITMVGWLSLLSFPTFFAYGEEVLTIMNKDAKPEKVDKKSLQDLYSGEDNRIAVPEGKVGAKLCKREDESVRKAFFDSIGKSENVAAADAARNASTGRGDKILPQKQLSDAKKVLEFVQVNKDGGLCYITKKEYDSLSEEDKKAIKVVNPPAPGG